MGNKLKTVDAETLLSTPMSKTMFIVDGLISQGVNVISGASKIGKSWLMLWLGLQVAQGNSIWGLPTLQCDVLYLSLEDRFLMCIGADWASTKSGSCPNRCRRRSGHFCSAPFLGLWGGCSSSAAPSA